MAPVVRDLGLCGCAATALLLVAFALFADASTTRSAQAQGTVNLVDLIPGQASFDDPVYATAPPDGSNRIFVVERTGRIWVIRDGLRQPTPFVDLTGVINHSSGGEMGLLGLTFHPSFATNGLFYITYTANNPAPGPDNDLYLDVLASLQVSPPSSDVANAGSRTVLLAIPDFATNHNGGMVAFGPGGYLYLSTGDGGGSNDPRNNAQNGSSLLGKILRLDVQPGAPYGIPPGNPFAPPNDPGGAVHDEIWALGLRNPWRFSFDRQTGELYIGDVGQSAREEINRAANGVGGQNYEWDCMEGFLAGPGACSTLGSRTPPVVDYGRGEGFSVTGGYVSRGPLLPSYVGQYFYGDFGGRIWTLPHTLVRDAGFNISSFGEDRDGNLLVVDFGGGRVYRMEEARAPTATPTIPPSPTATPTVTFTPTRTPVVPVVGGKGLGITSSGSTVLSWTGGTAQSSYLVARVVNGTSTFGPLGAGATTFTDPAPPGFGCYLVLPLAGTPPSPIAQSDALCAVTGVKNGNAPPGFTLRLHESTLARLSWTPPGGQTGYFLIPFVAGPSGLVQGSPIPLPASATSAQQDTQGAVTCYALIANFGTTYPNTELLCAIPGVASFGGQAVSLAQVRAVAPSAEQVREQAGEQVRAAARAVLPRQSVSPIPTQTLPPGRGDRPGPESRGGGALLAPLPTGGPR